MLSTQCLDCKNYLGVLTCKAFPDGIPAVISSGEFDHSKPYPGDNEIRFEAIMPALGQQPAPKN